MPSTPKPDKSPGRLPSSHWATRPAWTIEYRRPREVRPGRAREAIPGVGEMVSVRKLALAAAVALSASGPLVTATAFAESEVNGRLENQQERIREGYANGSLTHDEACRLE